MNSHRKHTVTEISRVERLRSCASYCAAGRGNVMFGQGHDVDGGATLT